MANNLLGIDYGSERVGLAIASGSSPQRLTTLENNDDLMQRLDQLSAENDIDTLVIGLPRTSDGNDTAWTAEVRRFASEAQQLGLSVILQDEFGTSAAARERLGNNVGERHEGLVDQEAAVILLEDYLAAN